MRSIALGGLAQMLASDDPERAAELASEALELAVNERPELLVIAGWVALRRGELERAACSPRRRRRTAGVVVLGR